MARIIFLLLVFANILLFAWMAGYLGEHETGREPERLRQQLEPDRLHVSRQGDAHPVEAAKATEPTAIDAAKVAEPLRSEPETVCRRIGPLAAVEAEKLKTFLAARGVSAVALAVEEVSYWVFIPPNSAKTPEKVSGELKQLGVTDFFVVNEAGPDRGAISLGLFHREAAAKDFMQQLAKKGVRSAKIGDKSRKSDKVRLQARGGTNVLEPLLQGLSVEAVECPRE